MDAPEVVPQRVHPKKKPCVDGNQQQHSQTSMGRAISEVLNDDNILIEILIRVGFPTTLVRAALVCKRWYHHASDRGFLCRFRKRNPPRLLGLYIDVRWTWLGLYATPRFVPMQPQAPELDTVVRRVASHSFDAYGDGIWIMHCQNGSIFTRYRKGTEVTHGVYRPLCPERDMDFIPPLPTAQNHMQKLLGAILSKEEGDGLSYLYVLAECTTQTKTFKVRVYMLQGGVWCMHTSATTQLPHMLPALKAVLVDDKIYMADVFSNDIIVLDLATSSFSRILLPQGVKYHTLHTILSRADDASGLYLIHVHVKEHQLCIWLHKGDNWLLVDTLCLHQMWANLRMQDHTLEDEDISYAYISQVGDNVQFVFLKTMCGRILYLDVTSRTLHKVHGMTEKDRHFSAIYPFMMIWPPIFPALKDDQARQGSWVEMGQPETVST